MNTRALIGVVLSLSAGGVVAHAGGAAPVPVLPPPAPVGDLQVDTSDASTSAVWEAMQKGAMSPEEAWKQGVLDAATVQDGLSKGLAGGEDDKLQKLRVGLGGVLVQHAPEVVADALRQPKQVQRALADYDASIGDERAAPLYEAVLKQTDRLREQGLVILQLGNFWTQQRQPQKAQDAYERGRKALTGKDPYFAGEMVIMAARAWAQNGDPEKARLLYARIPQGAGAWMTGMALWDEANVLMGQGKYQEARVLLQRPLQGERADQMKVALTASLGLCYYLEGDFTHARSVCKDALAQFHAFKNPPTDVEGQANNAFVMLMWLDRWKDDPNTVYCEPLSPISVDPNAPPDQPISRQLAVRTFRQAEVTVSTDNKNVVVQPTNEGKANRQSFFFQNLFDLRFDPNYLKSLTEDTDVVVTVHALQPKKTDLQVTLRIHIRNEDDCPTCGNNSSG